MGKQMLVLFDVTTHHVMWMPCFLVYSFWCIKWLVVIGLVVAFFFIPEGANYTFGNIILGFGLAGSILFILIQVVLLVDFAHTWAETWIGYAEENDNKGWYIVTLHIGGELHILLKPRRHFSRTEHT